MFDQLTQSAIVQQSLGLLQDEHGVNLVLLTVLLTSIVTMLVTALSVAAVMRRRARINATLEFERGLQSASQAHQIEIERAAQQYTLLEERFGEAEYGLASRDATVEALQDRLGELQEDYERQREHLVSIEKVSAANKARLEEAQLGFTQREAIFRENSTQLKKEFEALANKVFDQQQDTQRSRLQSVLTPFREQIGDFRKRVDEVYHTDAKERASLLTEVKNLQQASERINDEAENLTRALKGDKKLQGNWGELVLERVLESSGLRKDHEYFVQATLRTEAGNLKRPDVIIRLPDNKDVVVDSKVSLNAYERALACENDAERETFLRQHLLHLRQHVKRLSEQEYDQLPDVRSLDFVLMFIPIESAFTMAMEVDHKLFTEAFAKRIVLVSPTTLMMTLRIIDNVWRYEKQNNNAQEIARRAGGLYDKLRILVEEVDTLGKQLNTVQRTYQHVHAKLTTGRGNLVRQAEQFRELGAQVKIPMDPKLIENAQDEMENLEN